MRRLLRKPKTSVNCNTIWPGKYHPYLIIRESILAYNCLELRLTVRSFYFLFLIQTQYSKEYIEKRVTHELKDAVEESKKRKRTSIEDCMSDESKVRIRNKISAKQRAPSGPFDIGYARTIALPGLEHMTKQDVRHRQGTGFCKSEYNTVLETVYENSWREAVSSCRRKYSLQDPATAMELDPGVGSSSAIQKDVDRVVGGMEEGGFDTLTHEEESAIAREGEDRNERHCYTFSMSLNQAIAPSLRQHTDIVADLCKSKQIALTNMVDELFALVMKTTLLVSILIYLFSVRWHGIDSQENNALIGGIFIFVFLIDGRPTRTATIHLHIRKYLRSFKHIRCQNSLSNGFQASVCCFKHLNSVAYP